MATHALMEALPELLVQMRRDGTILAYSSGQEVASLTLTDSCIGKNVETVWPAALAALLKQLARKAITLRSAVEASFLDCGRDYEVRVSAQGPDRAICVIRPVLKAASGESLEGSDERRAPRLDRRSFLRRLRESVSVAALREKPISLAVLYIDGITDVARLIDAQIAEEIMNSAILRLPVQPNDATTTPRCYLGQLSDSCLSLVIDSTERDAVADCVARFCDSLREPIATGTSEFHLTPYAGVADMGQAAVTAKVLLARAHSAAAEARHSGSQAIVFFSDTATSESLAQLDVAQELNDAIRSGGIRLRYVGRHDLATGKLVAQVGYVRWLHPLRGEIKPVEFLRVAEATGLAAALSRAVLACLREDCAARRSRGDAEVRISFGALRHHILHEDFLGDVTRFLAEAVLPAEALELRIAEKTFIACDPGNLQALRRLGVQLVVDEVARGMGSLDWLARAPLWGLQLDRAWVAALRTDEVALKVCRAGVAVATALGLTPIATGVDDAQLRDTLLSLGCRYGSGDMYRQPST